MAEKTLKVPFGAVLAAVMAVVLMCSGLYFALGANNENTDELTVESYCTSENLPIDVQLDPSDSRFSTEDGYYPGFIANAVFNNDSTTYYFSHAQILDDKAISAPNQIKKYIDKNRAVEAIRYNNGQWEYRISETNSFSSIGSEDHLVFFYNQKIVSQDEAGVAFTSPDWAWSEDEWVSAEKRNTTTYSIVRNGKSTTFWTTLKPSVIVYQFYDENGDPIGESSNIYYASNYDQTLTMANLAPGIEAEVKLLPLSTPATPQQAYEFDVSSYASFDAIDDAGVRYFDNVKNGDNIVVNFGGEQALLFAVKLISTEYTVTYEDGNDNVLQTEKVPVNSPTPDCEEPEMDGYSFAGWRVKGTDSLRMTRVTQNVTYAAQWVEDETGGSTSDDPSTSEVTTVDCMAHRVASAYPNPSSVTTEQIAELLGIDSSEVLEYLPDGSRLINTHEGVWAIYEPSGAWSGCPGVCKEQTTLSAPADAPGEDKTVIEGNTGNANIAIETEASTINVTVPTNAAFIFKSDGTNVYPSNYEITNNNGLTAITLDAIDFEGVNGWNLTTEDDTFQADIKKFALWMGQRGNDLSVVDVNDGVAFTGDTGIKIAPNSSKFLDFKAKRGVFSQPVTTENAMQMTMHFDWERL